MRDSERNKRTYITVGLCSILMIMVVGFAAFSQQLQINSTSEVTGDWCLGFDNTKTNTLVATPGIQTGTIPTGSMTYAGSTCGTKSQVGVTLASTFKQPGDSIVYTLTIINEGSLNAAIKSILVDNTSVTSDQTITKGNIKYKIEMPLSTSVAEGESTTMKVTASFQNDTDITKSFGGDSATIEVKVNAEQDDGNGGFTPTVPAYTGTIYRHNKIETNIGDSIVPVTGTKWCDVETSSGNQYDCFNTETECNEYLSDNNWTETDTCQQRTVTFDVIGEYTTSQSEIQSQYNFYLKHKVVDDIITESYVCFVSDTEHCMKGGDGGASFAANTAIIQGYQTYYSGQNPSCLFDSSRSSCFGGPFTEVNANSSGNVKVDKLMGGKVIVDHYCQVSVDGGSECKND